MYITGQVLLRSLDSYRGARERAIQDKIYFENRGRHDSRPESRLLCEMEIAALGVHKVRVEVTRCLTSSNKSEQSAIWTMHDLLCLAISPYGGSPARPGAKPVSSIVDNMAICSRELIFHQVIERSHSVPA